MEKGLSDERASWPTDTLGAGAAWLDKSIRSPAFAVRETLVRASVRTRPTSEDADIVDVDGSHPRLINIEHELDVGNAVGERRAPDATGALVRQDPLPFGRRLAGEACEIVIASSRDEGAGRIVVLKERSVLTQWHGHAARPGKEDLHVKVHGGEVQRLRPGA
jgi:hypothetical protein